MISKAPDKEEEVKLNDKASDKFLYWIDEDQVSNKCLFDKSA